MWGFCYIECISLFYLVQRHSPSRTECLGCSLRALYFVWIRECQYCLSVKTVWNLCSRSLLGLWDLRPAHMQLSIWPGILRHRLYTSVSYAVTGFYSLVPWTADPTSVTPNSDLFFLCSERLFFYLNSTSFHCALGNVPGKSQMQDHLLCFPLPK